MIAIVGCSGDDDAATTTATTTGPSTGARGGPDVESTTTTSAPPTASLTAEARTAVEACMRGVSSGGALIRTSLRDFDDAAPLGTAIAACGAAAAQLEAEGVVGDVEVGTRMLDETLLGGRTNYEAVGASALTAANFDVPINDAVIQIATALDRIGG
ncbi:MAG: hypothetical protein ABIO83_03040 [Ilumatobacteraceae bacterium]